MDIICSLQFLISLKYQFDAVEDIESHRDWSLLRINEVVLHYRWVVNFPLLSVFLSRTCCNLALSLGDRATFRF